MATLQRFSEPAANPAIRPSLDTVLSNVRAASKTNGVTWGMMFDLSGLQTEEIFPQVSQDRKRLMDEFNSLAHENYIHNRNKPVVVVWGVGFNEPGCPASEAYGDLIFEARSGLWRQYGGAGRGEYHS